MATRKKASEIPASVLAAARERAAQARQRIEQTRTDGNLLTAEEVAEGAPFYFVLRTYIHSLKTAREAAGLTLADVSARSGIAVESLSRLETGASTNPTWKTLGMFAKAVGCRPELSAVPRTTDAPGTTSTVSPPASPSAGRPSTSPSSAT
jgi:DNA-binding XRE family transcriptional regulator